MLRHKRYTTFEYITGDIACFALATLLMSVLVWFIALLPYLFPHLLITLS